MSDDEFSLNTLPLPSEFGGADNSTVLGSTLADLPEHLEIREHILDYVHEKPLAMLRQTVTNLLQLVSSCTIVPYFDSSSPLTSEQVKTIGRQIITNIQTALHSSETSSHGKVMIKIIESNFSHDAFLKSIKTHVKTLRANLHETAHKATPPLQPSAEACSCQVQHQHAEARRTVERAIKQRKAYIITTVDQELHNQGVTLNAHDRQQFIDQEYEFDEVLLSLNGQLDDLQILMKDATNALFARQMEEYQSYMSKKESYSLLKTRYDQYKNMQTAVETVLNGYENCFRSITNAIRAQIPRVYEIHSYLQGNATIPATSESIIGPLQKGHLPGIYAILVEHYYQPSLVDFAITIRNTVQMRKGQDVPILEYVAQVERTIETWQRLQYWQYMTPDMFFTMICLHGLPSGVYEKSSHFLMDKLEEKAKSNDQSSDDHSTVHKASSHVQNYDHLFAQMSSFKELKAFLTKVVKSKSLSMKKSQPNQQYNKGQSEAEAAHSVKVTTKPASRSTTNNLETLDKKFSTEVSADFQYTIPHPKHKDRNASYTATLHKCVLCYPGGEAPQSGHKATNQHSPRCYGATCKNCNLFGHQDSQCRQTEQGTQTSLLSKSSASSNPSGSKGAGASTQA